MLPAVGLSALDEAGVIQAAVTHLRRVVDASVAFSGEVARSRSSIRLRSTVGMRTGAIDGLDVTASKGLGGRVLASGNPYWVNDYLTDGRISHDYDFAVAAEGLSAIAAVPVRLDREVCAVLYCGLRGAVQIDARTVDRMMHVAGQAAFELRVRLEVTRRMAALETSAALRAVHETPTAEEWEQVREAHAELRLLALQVDDPATRDRVIAISDRLGSREGSPIARSVSPRERDVLALVALGCGNREVATRLGLEVETVKSYLRSASRKLDAHTRMATVAAARRGGVLP
jgi:DNA-binding CsgD family transcriptional regulator